jgi:hypothetical protein
VRELKTLTEDIRQQIRAYQQISEDYESVLGYLRGLARHQQFKAVSTLLGTAFRADDHTTRLENLRALGSKMSSDERKLASEILKWGQEVRAVGARFDALDKTQNDLRRRGLDVGVRVAVSLADDLPRTQRVYYLALSKVLEGEIENLTTTVREVNQQLNNMGANP